MTISEIIILGIIGILAGFVAGALGVGGGIIIVPALVFIMGFTQHLAQGTSLAVLLFPVGILAVLNYHKQGYVNYKFAFILILTFIAGSYLGSLMSINMPDKILKKIFGVLMILAAFKMIFSK
ncbi:TSUP family transporter [Bacteroidota bacterium]